jgi:hypothetical protein
MADIRIKTAFLRNYTLSGAGELSAGVTASFSRADAGFLRTNIRERVTAGERREEAIVRDELQFQPFCAVHGDVVRGRGLCGICVVQ